MSLIFQFHCQVRPVVTAAASAAGVVAVDSSYRTVRYGLIEQWTVYAPHMGMAVMVGGEVSLDDTPLRARRLAPALGRHTVASVGGVHTLPVRWRGTFAACLSDGTLVRECIAPGGASEWMPA